MSEEYSTDKKNLSQIPSWIMVGFLVGITFMWFFDEPDEPELPPVAATPAVVEETPAPANPATLSLEVVELLFEEYRDWVFWSDNRTEIAVWNTQTLDFSDCYEVVRGEEGTFFRPIARLSRRPIVGYGPADSPILFTETPEQRARRYNDSRGGPPPRPEPEPIDLKPIPRSPGSN